MSITHPAADVAPEPRWRAGSIVLVVLGTLAAVVAFGLILAAGGLAWAQATQRDDDGYFAASEQLDTGSFALTHEGLDVTHTPDWVVDRLGTVRLRATASAGGEELFIGIASSAAVDGYLAGVAHEEVTRFEPGSGSDVETRLRDGGPPAGPPGEQGIWAASAGGPGTQTVTWEVTEGEWSAVVMNADGSRAVSADVEVGAKVDWVPALAAAFAVAGILAALVATLLIVLGVRRPAHLAPAAGAPAALSAPAAESTYPVAVEARLDEPLSRWLWLVKWLLAIPHWLVLTVLWCAFVVLTVVAFVAILFTGRYPRSIFAFNVGVLRWSWRVSYYAVAGIGTDRYPPFSLGPEPDYPATLDVPYPEQLSRGLVLVKSWLLAIPHLIVVAILSGSVLWGWTGRFAEWPGLIGVLTVVAGVVLLFRGRYPHDVWELVVGCSRWVWRVVAYVALMRDEYPPFRLGR